MKRPSPLAMKSRQLSLLIIPVAKRLRNDTKQFAMCDQLQRSTTAVGALVQEAQDSQSPKDMHNKIGIALKEAREAAYWIDLFTNGCGVSAESFKEINGLLNEVTAMLVASRKTLQQRL